MFFVENVFGPFLLHTSYFKECVLFRRILATSATEVPKIRGFLRLDMNEICVNRKKQVKFAGEMRLKT